MLSCITHHRGVRVQIIGLNQINRVSAKTQINSYFSCGKPILERFRACIEYLAKVVSEIAKTTTTVKFIFKDLMFVSVSYSHSGVQ